MQIKKYDKVIVKPDDSIARFGTDNAVCRVESYNEKANEIYVRFGNGRTWIKLNEVEKVIPRGAKKRNLCVKVIVKDGVRFFWQHHVVENDLGYEEIIEAELYMIATNGVPDGVRDNMKISLTRIRELMLTSVPIPATCIIGDDSKNIITTYVVGGKIKNNNGEYPTLLAAKNAVEAQLGIIKGN